MLPGPRCYWNIVLLVTDRKGDGGGQVRGGGLLYSIGHNGMYAYLSVFLSSHRSVCFQTDSTTKQL